MKKFHGWSTFYMGVVGIVMDWIVNPTLFANNLPTISVAEELAKSHGVLGALFGLALSPYLMMLGLVILNDEQKRKEQTRRN